MMGWGWLSRIPQNFRLIDTISTGGPPPPLAAVGHGWPPRVKITDRPQPASRSSTTKRRIRCPNPFVSSRGQDVALYLRPSVASGHVRTKRSSLTSTDRPRRLASAAVPQFGNHTGSSSRDRWSRGPTHVQCLRLQQHAATYET